VTASHETRLILLCVSFIFHNWSGLVRTNISADFPFSQKLVLTRWFPIILIGNINRAGGGERILTSHLSRPYNAELPWWQPVPGHPNQAIS